MTGNRRYRGEPSHPIPVWNGILEHLPKMGMSIWLYLWCLDRITKEQDGVGHVLGGAPVKIERIAKELRRSDRALRRDFSKLRTRYLRIRWTPYGYVIAVLNSHKFGIWKLKDSPVRSGEVRDKSGEAKTENGRSKEDPAVDTAVKQLPALSNSEDSIWSFLEMMPCGPLAFRALLESRWASKGGEPISELIGGTIDAWEVADGRKPANCAALFRALSDIRKRESQARSNETLSQRLPSVNDLRPKER